MSTSRAGASVGADDNVFVDLDMDIGGAGDCLDNTHVTRRPRSLNHSQSHSDTHTFDDNDDINLDDFTLSDALDTSTPEKDEEAQDTINELLIQAQRAPKRKRIASPNQALMKSKVNPADVPRVQEFTHIVPKVTSSSSSQSTNINNNNDDKPKTSTTTTNQNGTGETTNEPINLNQVKSKPKKPANIIIQSKVKETIVRRPQAPRPQFNLNPANTKARSWSVPQPKQKTITSATATAPTGSGRARVNPAAATKNNSGNLQKRCKSPESKPKPVSSNFGKFMQKTGEPKVRSKASTSETTMQNGHGHGGRGQPKPKDKAASKNITTKPSASASHVNTVPKISAKNKGSSTTEINTIKSPNPKPNSTSKPVSPDPSNANIPTPATTTSNGSFLSEESESVPPDSDHDKLTPTSSGTNKLHFFLLHSNADAPIQKEEEKHLFRSHFWSFIDPEKYPPSKGQLTNSKTPERERAYDPIEVQSYIEKQRELRKDKEKHEAELKKKQITKKKLQLAELDMKRRELVAKSKMSPVVGPKKSSTHTASGSAIPRPQNLAAAKTLFKPPIPHQQQTKKSPKNIATPSKSSITIPAPKPNKIPIEEVDQINENNNLVKKKSISKHVDQNSDDFDLNMQILLQDFENVLHRECLSVLRKRTEHLERSVSAKQNQNFQRAHKAVETTLSLCEDAPTATSLSHSRKSKPQSSSNLNTEKMNLAAAKIQAAFRSYKVRKIWREVEEAKREKVRRSSLSLRKNTMASGSRSPAQKKGPLKVPEPAPRKPEPEVLTAFGLKLNFPSTSYIPPPPPAQDFSTVSDSDSSLSLHDSSNTNNSKSKFNRFRDEAYPKEAIQKLASPRSSNSDILLANRRKSIEGSKFNDLQLKSQRRESLSNAIQAQTHTPPRRSAIMPKSIQEFQNAHGLGPAVPTFSTVLREKMRLLKERSALEESDNDSDSTRHASIILNHNNTNTSDNDNEMSGASSASGGTITDDYIGPGREEMEKAYKIRTGATGRLTLEPTHRHGHGHQRRQSLPAPQSNEESPTKPSSDVWFNSPRSTTTVETDDELKNSGTSSVDLDDFLSPIRKFQQVAERKRREVLEHALETALAISLGPKYDMTFGSSSNSRRQTIDGSSVSYNQTQKSPVSSSRKSSETDKEKVEKNRRQALEKALKSAEAIQIQSQTQSKLSTGQEEEEPTKDKENLIDFDLDVKNMTLESSAGVESYSQEFYSEKSDVRQTSKLEAGADAVETQQDKIVEVKPAREPENLIELQELDVTNNVEQISEIEPTPISISDAVPEDEAGEISHASLIKSVPYEPELLSKLETMASISSPKSETQLASPPEQQNHILESLAPVTSDDEISSVQEQNLLSPSQLEDISESNNSANVSVKDVLPDQVSEIVTEQGKSILEPESENKSRSNILEDVIHSIAELELEEPKTNTILEPISEHYSTTSFLTEDQDQDEDEEGIVDANQNESKSEAEAEAQAQPSLALIDSYSEAFTDAAVEASLAKLLKECQNENISTHVEVEKDVDVPEKSGDEDEIEEDTEMDYDYEKDFEEEEEMEMDKSHPSEAEDQSKSKSQVIDEESHREEEIYDEDDNDDVSQIPNPPTEVEHSVSEENTNTGNEDVDAEATADLIPNEEPVDGTVTSLEEVAELALISKKQMQIEEEIRLLQSRDSLPAEEKYREAPPLEEDEEPYAVFPDEEFTNTTPIFEENLYDFNTTPPPPYIPEIPKPVTCLLEVAQNFIDVKVESMWENWVKTGIYNPPKSPPPTDAVFNFDSEEHRNFENSHQSFVMLYNDVFDEIIQESLQTIEKPFVEQIRPGLITYKTQKLRIPKSKDELKLLVLKQFLDTVNPGHLVGSDGDPIPLPIPTNKLSTSNPIRPRGDRVDEILLVEAKAEDKEWINTWPEQLLLKDAVAELLLKRTIREMLDQLKSIGDPLSIPSKSNRNSTST